MLKSALDITAFVCPMTFVRAKLHMETLSPGTVTEIRLKGSEPLQNVPRSLMEQGFEVLDISPEAGAATDTTEADTTVVSSDQVHIVTVRKPA